MIDAETWAPAPIIAPAPMHDPLSIIALLSTVAVFIINACLVWIETSANFNALASASPLTKSREPFNKALGVPMSNQYESSIKPNTLPWAAIRPGKISRSTLITVSSGID
ncbi:unannotated protein [freshwater metagenome]|uniref:Unannotated protein n=1 Tax=freshwater metagenome TaxID=449393 RepID=A0A6J6SZK5_9ZZZZ